ncbi:DUF305 domain-containing protein [Gloeocapsopsis crepidinum LEGE 06123]|uniref:DUF305 domain-containing protein n=1 Tax=Gloeocapsopsis crepidinum LEGE 06123 TaxID=588587 RepID=A0ABR9V103_9CHRO|nr:DUF305 domain-containing protein [Gloeocapsopsis crepidinum]MBE9193178.1 DUF305 domain-containing protein [Gloeocapsopsis crepidinum LEGE 06123]
MKSKSDMKPYIRLLIALSISYVVMAIIMLSRVNVWSNVFLSLNQIYMAGLMVAPMLIIMLTVMGSMMYQNKRVNIVLLFVGAALIGLFWMLVRTQAAVGNQQFLRSMIPHHAAAILVCEQASITDQRIQQLCEEIVATQEREIRIMKALLQ